MDADLFDKITKATFLGQIKHLLKCENSEEGTKAIENTNYWLGDKYFTHESKIYRATTAHFITTTDVRIRGVPAKPFYRVTQMDWFFFQRENTDTPSFSLGSITFVEV